MSDLLTATNPNTGEKIAFIDGAWTPVEATATNPKTKERMFQLGGVWHSANELDNTTKPSTPEPSGSEGKQQGERILALAKDAAGSHTDPALGAFETGLSAASGIGSTILGGLAGAARTGYNLLAGEGIDKSAELGAKTVEAVQHAATYQPRSSMGKLGNEVLGFPVNAAKDLVGTVGGKMGEGYGMIADAIVNGGIEGRDIYAGEGAVRGRNAGEAISRAGVDVAAVEAGRGQAMQAANRASIRVREPKPGTDFTPLRDLTPAERERMTRQIQVDENGITLPDSTQPTLASITRDPSQFRFEDQTGKTPEGANLRTRELDNNAAMIKAIEQTDALRPGKRATENTREAGRAVANALEQSNDETGAMVDALYQKARDAGETKAIVDTKPLEDYLHETRFKQETSVPELRTIQKELNALKKETGNRVTIDMMEELYKSAGELAGDGSSGHFMGKVKAKINEVTDGSGGDLYRQARAARNEQALEFDDRSAIANLIDKKAGSRTDYKTQAEDVFNKVVVNSSLTQLQDVVSSLLTNNPAAGRVPKLQAFRELQAETVSHLLGKATEKGGSNERAQSTLSATSLRNAINDIGTEKLNYILGPDALKRLTDTVDNAIDFTQSPGRVKGSETNINSMDTAKQAAMDSAKKYMFSNIPYIGKPIGVIRDFMGKRAEASALQQRISDSLTPSRASAEEIARQLDEWKSHSNQAFKTELLDAGKGAAYVGEDDSARRALSTKIDMAHSNYLQSNAAATAIAADAQRAQLKAEIEKARKRTSIQQIGAAKTVDDAIKAFQNTAAQD